MNIKSLLLGSAAALAVVSGAQAADAIVAAEPEPMEYVRVCDAFGTGFFYIPGTETCLKIGGQVRFSYDWSDDSTDNDNFQTRARVNFTANSDSEVGVISAYMQLEATSDATVTGIDDDGDDVSIGGNVILEEAYISVGGLKVGYTYNMLGGLDLPGESESFRNDGQFDLISYTYASDAFTAGISIDELSNVGFNDLGVTAMASASLGAATVGVYGGYDFDAEEGIVGLKASAELGPGTLTAYGAYASGSNAYASVAEWTVGAAYGFNATEKLKLTAQAVYWDEVGFVDGSQWAGDLLAEYKIASGLTASANVKYVKPEDVDGTWSGFVRLTRSF
ncbi:MAG: porin [Allorhizobium sp.]